MSHDANAAHLPLLCYEADMGAELTISFSDLDLAGLLADLRARALLSPWMELLVERELFEGVATAAPWGRFLPAGDDRAWQEAQEDMEAGSERLETITDARGHSLDVLLCPGTYAELTLAALRATGTALFSHRSELVRVSLRPHPDADPLILHFDSALRATGGRSERASEQGPTTLWSADTYLLDARHAGGVPAYIAALELLCALRSFGSLEISDPLEYLEHHSYEQSVWAYLEERLLRTRLRAAFRLASEGELEQLRSFGKDTLF